jgi:hypothetical protein
MLAGMSGGASGFPFLLGGRSEWTEQWLLLLDSIYGFVKAEFWCHRRRRWWGDWLRGDLQLPPPPFQKGDPVEKPRIIGLEYPIATRCSVDQFMAFCAEPQYNSRLCRNTAR